jgi:DNA-binding transcriptional LysR family regulator
MPKPTVTKLVQSLEAHLRIKLLNRTTRRQSLSEVGKIYYERCKLVLAEADWADAAGSDATGTPRGRLRVNAPVSFGTHTLMPLVSMYLRQNPGVEVELILNDRFVDLVEEGFEAVFRTGPLADSLLAARALRPFRLLACASPGYLRRHASPQTPQDLQQHNCLTFDRGGRNFRTWRFGRDGTWVDVRVKGDRTVDDASLAREWAVAGAGVLLKSQIDIRNELLSGALVPLLPEWETEPYPLHALLPSGRFVPARVRALVDFLAERFSRANA